MDKIKIFAFGAVLVAMLGMILYFDIKTPTGNVVYNKTEEVFLQNAARVDAVNAIIQSEADIQSMINSGFGVASVNDSLKSARQAMERADFAELIRKNATGELAEKARKALEGLDYAGFSYDEVLKHTQEIRKRKQKAYELSDLIRAAEIKIEDYKILGIETSEAERILSNARTAFENERYAETESILTGADSELEKRKAESAMLIAIVKSGKGIIENNWIELSVAIIVVSIASWIIWKKTQKNRIYNRLKKLKAEKETLLALMKKTQEERFGKGTIPNSIYNIRKEKYNRRLNEIKETIPVLEGMLRKSQK